MTLDEKVDSAREARIIHRPFEARAAQTPQAIAVERDGRGLSYRELNRRANQVAHRLRALGVGPEVPVAICMERSIEMVAAMLGILKAGGVYVPLDPAYPPDRLGFMLEDTRAPVLLTDGCLGTDLPVHGIHTVEIDATWKLPAGESEQNRRSSVEPHHLAYIIYTSGSTGKPKGVCVPHEAALRHFTTMQALWELSAADRVLAFASFSFDASLEQIFPTLYSGAAVVLRGAEGWGAGEFSRTARTLRLTVADLPTAYWDQWVQACRLDGDWQLPPDLRLVAIGGDAARAETVRRWGETALRSIRLVNAYGPTETTITASIHELTPGLDGDVPLERVPIGRPLPGRTMHILDQHGAPVADGEAGELHIGGAGLARGYLNRPDLTAEKFIPDPFDGRPGARLYRTGDLARMLPDGTIEFLGRVDRQVKIRGFRIELGEIEECLSRHPAVQDAVVLAREDVPGDRRLVAYVVAREEVTSRQLRAFLQAELPTYMLPAAMVFLGELPISPNGKVDRAALPRPDGSRPELSGAYVPPRTPIEERLARIWAHVLRVERIGVHDRFSELGGDSLLAMHVVARAAEVDLRFTADQLYRCQTIAELAAQTRTGGVCRAEQGTVAGPVPLTPALAHFLAAPVRRTAGSEIEALSFELPQALDAALLEQALRHVIAHHDTLRLRFHRHDSGWGASNAAQEEGQILATVDLAACHGPVQEATTVEAALAEAEAGLDLIRGPLLKALLFTRGAGRPGHLVVLIHHLAVDAYSEPIIMQDLETAYRQLKQGQAVQLPAKTTSFKSWAERLAAYARGPELQAELGYWLSLQWDRVSRLPSDFPGTADALGQVGHVKVQLSVEETSALLHDFAPALEARFSDLLLVALSRAFGAWTGSDALLLRLISHGREPLFDDVDLSRTVGWLTTAYPVLLDTDGTAPPADAVRAVQAQMRRIPAHGIGYGLLRNLGPREAVVRLERLPRPEVHLNYVGQVDQMHSGLSLFDRREEPSQPASRRLLPAFSDVRVKAQIEAGQLHLRIGYHENVYRRTTIARVASDAMVALRAMLREDGSGLLVGTAETQAHASDGSASRRRVGHAAA
jgi:amino acid adenylation domain-containing protein/non-ribosomal peptide synthase protein (TIGR01720 family)